MLISVGIQLEIVSLHLELTPIHYWIDLLPNTPHLYICGKVIHHTQNQISEILRQYNRAEQESFAFSRGNLENL